MTTRFAVLLSAGVPLVLFAASVDIQPSTPNGAPEATINLATGEGARLVKGQWRYSDTKIVEVDFRGPGPDSQPTGAPIRTYDYTPHAGVADFDDSIMERLHKPPGLIRYAAQGSLETGATHTNWLRPRVVVTLPPDALGRDILGALPALLVPRAPGSPKN